MAKLQAVKNTVPLHWDLDAESAVMLKMKKVHWNEHPETKPPLKIRGLYSVQT